MGAVICDKCSEEFEPGDIETKTLKEDIQVQEFSCPHCAAKYIVLATDEELRQMIKRRIQLANRQRLAVEKRLKENTLRMYINEIDKLDNEIKENERELRERFKNDLSDYVNM